MEHPLEGIVEKLKRADESIRNLNGEINAFLDAGDYRRIPDKDGEIYKQALESHAKRGVPLRFSVLIGEIVHHLRSSLDHLAWTLSSDDKRGSDPDGIEYPIFKDDPSKVGKTRSYQRKVKGVCLTAKALIEETQPYKRPMGIDPLDHPLQIIHDMDRFDKHRELALTIPTFNLRIAVPVGILIALKGQAEPSEMDMGELQQAMNMDSEMTTQVSFCKFGRRERQAVIPGLEQLARETRDIISLFTRFL